VDEGLLSMTLAQSYVSSNGNYFSHERSHWSCAKYRDFTMSINYEHLHVFCESANLMTIE
jgi:hypothetical protein